jgi:hypothetical protein
VVERDQIISEKEKLYLELKKILARQPGNTSILIPKPIANNPRTTDRESLLEPLSRERRHGEAHLASAGTW